MGLIGLIRAYGGLLGILSGLTKSTDHPSRKQGFTQVGEVVNWNCGLSYTGA